MTLFRRIQRWASSRAEATFIALTVVMATLFAAAPQAESARYTVHRTNFYLLAKNHELFYPVAANAGHLLREPERMAAELDRLAESGVNTVRIAVDDALAASEPYDEWATPEGELRDAVLARLDALFDAAEARELAIILILFDLQTMGERWPSHRFHISQGGPCEELTDFFGMPEMRRKAQRFIAQIARRYQTRSALLAWEIARGANLDEHPALQSPELTHSLGEWLSDAVRTVRQADRARNLTAISCLPNTLPFRVMRAADIVMLSMRSGDVNAAAESLPQYLDFAQERRRPVFLAEAEWLGPEDGRSSYYRVMSMLSLVKSSSMFLSPVLSGDEFRFSGDDLQRTRALTQLYLPLLNLDGEPRPPSRAPVEIRNPDQHVYHETIIGNDRIFWLRRYAPGRDKTQLTFHTVQGFYKYQWLDVEQLQVGPSREFMLIRTYITLESPEYEQEIIGVLRLVRRPDDKYRIDLPTP